MARGVRLGPDNPVEQWLNAYHHGDVNQLAELNDWRNGDYGWVRGAPKPCSLPNKIPRLLQELMCCLEAIT